VGSFNFTKAADEHNAENLLVIRHATLAERYTANRKARAEHSEAYQGWGGDAAPGERPPRRKAA
jgi:phosphatidylserine/phosphatidylglycerophosphate/cardiolipin synthase-like enzyme